MASISK